MCYFKRVGGGQHELKSRVPKAAETEKSAENTSHKSKIAILPVLHTVFLS